MLCARVLRTPREGEKQNIVLRGFEAMFRRSLHAYEWSLDRVLARRGVMLVVTIATLAGSVLLYVAIPKGFFPPEDTGFILAWTEGPTDISFQGMGELQKQDPDIMLLDPSVHH